VRERHVNPYPVDQIRAEYSALNDISYLNTGTIGLMSETVLRNHLDRIAQYERLGHFGEADARYGYEDARREFARLINASPEEVALTRNASDGANLAVNSMTLPDNAVLLTTNEEHPAVLLPLTIAARSAGGHVRLLDLGGSNEEILTALESMVTSENVSLAAISHVSCETGRRLPIAEMCRICAENGVLTLVDGAQSVGQFDVDIADIGCDFMTGNGHKWLCGPKGTGFLYVRQDRIADLTPAFVGDGSVEPSFNRYSFDPNDSSPDWRFRTDAQRFEFGTRNWHLFGGVVDAIQELRHIGWSGIQKHVDELTSELKTELASRSGVTIHTPSDWIDSCGLVTFSVDGWQGTELSQRLWHDHGIIQRRVQIPNGVRISCAHYTSREDLDRFLGALDTLM
jgi:selenocysteine lyase/cysteine desulfurase